MSTHEILAQKLRAALASRGLTEVDAAAAIATSVDGLRAWIAGSSSSTTETDRADQELADKVAAWLQQNPPLTGASSRSPMKKKRYLSETELNALSNTSDVGTPVTTCATSLCRDADVTESVFGVGTKKTEFTEAIGSSASLATAMGATQPPGHGVVNAFSLSDTRASLLPSRASTIDDFVPITVPVPASAAGPGPIQDAFVWNANSFVPTPEEFASVMCSDLRLPARSHGEIADAIRLQTAQHRQVMSQICAKYGVASTAELPAHVAVFRLHIIKGDYEYKDAFEWDLMADFSAVQLFADVTCSDLGLPSGWESAIVVAMLKQRRELLLRLVAVHPDTSTMLHSPEPRLRTEAGRELYTPVVKQLPSSSQAPKS